MRNATDPDGRAPLPGAEIVNAGVSDLAANRESIEGLAVAMAAGRLRDLGVDVPPCPAARPSHRLYELLSERDGRSAHSHYNALAGRIISFAHAAEHARRR